MSDQEDLGDFDLAAAGLRLDGADVLGSAELLAGKLEQALPGRVSVRRGGGGLLRRGDKRLREVRIELGSSQYGLELDDGRLRCTRGREVGGIAIKRESLEPAPWLVALSADLREEARRSGEAREALQRLLG